MKKIIFSGGGTGGHIYPALAIREILLKNFPDFLETVYIGLSDGMEAKIVKRIPNLPFFPVEAQGLPRALSLKLLSFPFKNVYGCLQAINYLKDFSPDLVVSTGGYVAFPVLFAARFLGKKYVLHEQNAVMGVTNRIFAKGAEKILLTYPQESGQRLGKFVLTGNPVREEFFSRSCERNRFKKMPGEFWILVVGGSRGAASINKVCIDLAKTWLRENPSFRFVHITGERDFDWVKKEVGENSQYIVLPYLHEMREAFDVADLLISRAGATILAEMACCGKPAILIPFPHATDNHQEKNARILEQQGAAKVILEKELNAPILAKNLLELKEGGKLHQMAAKMHASRPTDVETRIFSALFPLLK